MKVLLVGEGDFSFTRSVLKLRKQGVDWMKKLGVETCGGEIHLVASSLDSRLEVLAKYPTFADFNYALDIRHEVNALEVGVYDGFDTVVWNHPHLGFEDAKMHAQLMVHFFNTLQQTQVKTVVLSFISGQLDRWQVSAAAQSRGFSLAGKSPFNEADFPGYVSRRNLSGADFRKNKECSTFYRFVRGAEVSRDILEETVEITGKDTPFACQICDKEFRSLQGVKTHCRQVHELGKYDSKSVFPCSKCDQQFGSNEGLANHFVSRHSVGEPQIEVSKSVLTFCDICQGTHIPDFSQVNRIELFECQICFHSFREARALRQHLQYTHSHSCLRILFFPSIHC